MRRTASPLRRCAHPTPSRRQRVHASAPARDRRRAVRLPRSRNTRRRRDAGSTAKPASSSARTISSHACSAPAASGSMSASAGHVASASPSRIPGRTPSASAAAVTGPMSGSPCGSGASAAGRSASVGVRRNAAFNSSPGMVTQAIMGTYVLYEHMFSCQLRIAAHGARAHRQVDLGGAVREDAKRCDRPRPRRARQGRRRAREARARGRARRDGRDPRRSRPPHRRRHRHRRPARLCDRRRDALRGDAGVARAAGADPARAPRSSRPLGSDLGARPTKQDRRRLDALRKGRRA